MTEEHMLCGKCAIWLGKLAGKPLKRRSAGKNVKDKCYCCGKRKYIQIYIVEEDEDETN